MSSTGFKKFAAVHFKDLDYCLPSYDIWRQERDGSQPVNVSFNGQDSMSHSENPSPHQRVPSFSQSQKRCHFRSRSALESTSCDSTTKRPRTSRTSDSQARRVSWSKKSVHSKKSPTSAPENHGNLQRVSRPKKTIFPLSSSFPNVPSTSSASTSFSSPHKARKVSDNKTSSGTKRSNFSKGQTGVLNGWLKLSLEHPYPTEDEKNLLAERAGISLNQVNNYYTNARRRSGYKKMCEERGVVPAPRKNTRRSPTSEEGNEENQAPVRHSSESGFGSDSSHPASVSFLEGVAVQHDQVRGSSSSPASSPTTEASQDPAFVADSGFNPVQSPPVSSAQVPVFVEGSGFVPAPPLPSDVSPEVLAVSRKVVEPVYIAVREGNLSGALPDIALEHPNLDVKAYKSNLPREYYVAQKLMEKHPNEYIISCKKPWF